MPYKVTITGLVQGVGFRPYVYQQAQKIGLHGYVKNTRQGVEFVVNKKPHLKEFFADKPPMARIDSIKVAPYSNPLPRKFVIKKSQAGQGHSEIPPDIFLCPDCLRDLRSQKSRRYRYPFISCTNCGPRYTVIESTPYDRKKTSMGKFKLCPACQTEYKNANTRWYHAETIACPDCGPRVYLLKNNKEIKTGNPIKACAELIKEGEIVAIKGIGGFHLVCSTAPKITDKLRNLTNRPRKPFALMARNLKQARKFVKINDLEKKHLQSPARPIVILQKKNEKLLPSVSDLDSLGIILPYTGLHYLLFDYLKDPVIFTSANFPGKPLTTTKEEQFVKYILDHDREILNPVDDSVVKIINNHTLWLRRARGCVPAPISVNTNFDSGKIALGAEQNSTFAFSFPGKIILSEHLGNLRVRENYQRYKKTINRYKKFYNFRAKNMVFDSNPAYRSTAYGKKLRLPKQQMQHHLAHVKSVAVEKNLDEYIGIAADGAGLGTDGTIWGGEVFLAQKTKSKTQIRRIGSLELQPMIGGDLATIQPPRMLLGILSKFLDKAALQQLAKRHFSATEYKILSKQLTENFNITYTSSTGRILDAASAMLGFCKQRTYEGEPAIKLEANSSRPFADLKPKIFKEKGLYRLHTTNIFEYLWKNKKRDKQRLAATIQKHLADGFWQIASKANQKKLPIVFSGGVAYNRIITTYLTKRGVIVNEKVPPGDGGIALGQLG